MKIVGLTGGIGSGKTTIAGFFRDLGVPVYIADDAGKRLLATSEAIREKVVAIFGADAYNGKDPNRSFIAEQVFNDSEKLSKLNAIIHPAVQDDFKAWLQDQDSIYVIYEAAILFETGGNKICDHTVVVTAPKEVRIARILKRDNTTREAILARMANQWDQDRKVALADYVIENTDLQLSSQRVKDIHLQILKAGQNC